MQDKPLQTKKPLPVSQLVQAESLFCCKDHEITKLHYNLCSAMKTPWVVISKPLLLSLQLTTANYFKVVAMRMNAMKD